MTESSIPDWSLCSLVVLLAALYVALIGGAVTAGAGSTTPTPVDADAGTAVSDSVPTPTAEHPSLALEGNGTDASLSEDETADDGDEDSTGDTDGETNTDDESTTDGSGPDSADDAGDEDDSADDTESTAAPSAAIDAPSAVDAGTSATLDADASDPGGDDEIVTYAWTISDDETETIRTDAPTLEYAFDEPGSATVRLEIATDDDRRAETSTVVDVVGQSPRIEGRIVRDSSRSDSRDRVRLVDGNDIVASERMGEDGSFTLSPDEPGAYDLVIYEDALRDETQRTSRNWNVDLYALGTVTVDDETVDVGTLEVPEGHTLETVVVENGSARPIKNATVTYTHRNDGATISHGGVTDEDGEAFLGWDVPEVAGDVEIVVEPPAEEDYVDTIVTETITVDEPTTTEIQLRKVVNASLEVESGANPNATADPKPVSVGENVTVTLEGTNGNVEAVTWTIDGQERIGTSNERDPAEGNRTATDSSENRTAVTSLEVRVTELTDFNVTAEVLGAHGTERTVSTTVPVTEPNRTIEFETPDRTATHTSFPTTVTHEVEHGNVSVERYEWLLRDDDGELVAAERTTDPATEFAVEKVGQYTLDLELRDEFGLTESATTTVEADSVPSWVTGGESRFEIDAIEAPHAVEPGGSVPLEVSAMNVGDAPGTAAVTVEADGDTLVDERLELGVGETESINLSPAAPERLGNHTLTVATDHERTAVSYTVTENPESSAVTAASPLDANADPDDEPQELELLPTPSTAADIEPPSPPRDRLRTGLLGSAVVAILGGFGLVGYVVYTRPERGPVTTVGSTEPSDSPEPSDSS